MLYNIFGDKMDCIFCKIIAGEIPAKKVYEDELVMAFLDVSPHTDGHTLIIPKKHYKDILEMDDEILKHIQCTAKKIFKLYEDKLDIKGMTLVQNNGYGQEVKHYHIHLVPRYKDDKLYFTHRKNNLSEIDDVYKKIAA